MEESNILTKGFLSRLRAAFIGSRDGRKVRTLQLDITQPGRLINGGLNVLLGLFSISLGIYVAAVSDKAYHEFYWPTLIYLLFGCCLTGLGLWTLHLYRHISRLSSVRDMCARLGIDAQE